MIKKAKGRKKCVKKRNLKFKDCKNCLKATRRNQLGNEINPKKTTKKTTTTTT